MKTVLVVLLSVSNFAFAGPRADFEVLASREATKNLDPGVIQKVKDAIANSDSNKGINLEKLAVEPGDRKLIPADAGDPAVNKVTYYASDKKVACEVSFFTSAGFNNNSIAVCLKK